jgi:hypothetical protein
MQERDEELAATYDRLDRKDRTILRFIIAVIVLGIPYIIKGALWVRGKMV